MPTQISVTVNSINEVSHQAPRRNPPCSSPSCRNRSVQGGLCIAHGAKRPTCRQPSCDTAVRLGGYCSKHGPPRRKCDHAQCGMLAVRGGRCKAHGREREVCKAFVKGMERCRNNAVAGGLCKKHGTGTSAEVMVETTHVNDTVLPNIIRNGPLKKRTCDPNDFSSKNSTSPARKRSRKDDAHSENVATDMKQSPLCQPLPTSWAKECLTKLSQGWVSYPNKKETHFKTPKLGLEFRSFKAAKAFDAVLANFHRDEKSAILQHRNEMGNVKFRNIVCNIGVLDDDCFTANTKDLSACADESEKTAAGKHEAENHEAEKNESGKHEPDVINDDAETPKDDVHHDTALVLDRSKRMDDVQESSIGHVTICLPCADKSGKLETPLIDDSERKLRNDQEGSDQCEYLKSHEVLHDSALAALSVYYNNDEDTICRPCGDVEPHEITIPLMITDSEQELRNIREGDQFALTTRFRLRAPVGLEWIGLTLRMPDTETNRINRNMAEEAPDSAAPATDSNTRPMVTAIDPFSYFRQVVMVGDRLLSINGVEVKDLDDVALLSGYREREFEFARSEHRNAQTFPQLSAKYEHAVLNNYGWMSIYTPEARNVMNTNFNPKRADPQAYWKSRTLPHLSPKYKHIYNKDGRVGIYTPEERHEMLTKFNAKRAAARAQRKSLKFPHSSPKFKHIYNKDGRIGIYTPAERNVMIAKLNAKRAARAERRALALYRSLLKHRNKKQKKQNVPKAPYTPAEKSTIIAKFSLKRARARVDRENLRAHRIQKFKIKNQCRVPDCTNQRQNSGVCRKHGSIVYRCKIADCSNEVCFSGRCKKHGSNTEVVSDDRFKLPTGKQCDFPDCDKLAQNSGVCRKHGAKVKHCRIEDCTNEVRNSGLCGKHGAMTAKGAKQRCSFEDCQNQALLNSGVCGRHGAPVKKCNTEGCPNSARNRGVCYKHGATRSKCKVQDCKKIALRSGFCRKHGGPIWHCKIEDCSNLAVKAMGVCFKHGDKLKGKVKRCSVEDCQKQVQVRGLCYKHGAYRTAHDIPPSVHPVDTDVMGVSSKNGDKVQSKVKRCSVEDCQKQVQWCGLCYKHGGVRPVHLEVMGVKVNLKAKRCSVGDCQKRVQKRGLCYKHGAYRIVQDIPSGHHVESV